LSAGTTKNEPFVEDEEKTNARENFGGEAGGIVAIEWKPRAIPYGSHRNIDERERECPHSEFEP